MRERLLIIWLVITFAVALGKKLIASENKYRWSGSWKSASPEMLNDQLMRHIEKGDPRDVAAYCAFAWYRKYKTNI